MTSLIDLLSPRYAPIQRVLLDHLNPGAIARLTCTCKAFGSLWPTLVASDYNINYKLRHFFKDPREFRSVQGECGALLDDCSEEFTTGRRLSFIARSKHECTHLSVWVEPTRMAPLADYLGSEGFVHYDPHPQEPDLNEGLYCTKRCGVDGKWRRVDLRNWNFNQLEVHMITRRATHEARFLTWNKAYTIFPYETFIKDTCHLTMFDDKYLWQYVVLVQRIGSPASWEGLGSWYWADGVLHVEMDGPSCITRRIGDSRTWILDLDTTGVSAPKQPDTIYESSTFELRRSSAPYIFTYRRESLGPKEYPRYDLLYENLSHAVLKYRYLIPPGTGPSVMNKKCDAILKKLDRLTKLELEKIPEAERPSAYYEFERGECKAMHVRDRFTREGFTLPATWTFYDEEILADLNDAWESRDEVWVQDEGRETAECEHEAIEVTGSDENDVGGSGDAGINDGQAY